MSSRCSQTNCFAPEVSCAFGELDHTKCEHFNSSGQDFDEAGDVALAEGTRLPWTGNAFGLSDAMFVSGATSGRLVAIIGSESAGKTSLLAAWYLLLGRGVSVPNIAFSGSYTLEGWENISSSLRWTSPSGPTFPPHTSSGAGRRPGLLHFAYKDFLGAARDVLFADTPGEWFSRWAVNQSAPDAAGAQWLSEEADVLLVVADSVALSGAERGVARGRFLELLLRVGANRRGRPTALVWTKCDIAVPESMVLAVRTAAQKNLGDHEEFRVSLHSAEGGNVGLGQGLVNLLTWVTQVAERPYVFADAPDARRELLAMVKG